MGEMTLIKVAQAIWQHLNKCADFRYSSAQLLFPEDIAEKFKQYKSLIDPNDIISDRGHPTPHITVHSGIQKFDETELKKILSKIPQPKVRIGGVSLFENPDADVIKFDIESDALHELNDILKRYPYTKLYPSYIPHATIAYVKPGTGKKYLDKFNDLIGKEISFSNLEISDKKGNKYIIPFKSDIYDKAIYDEASKLWRLIDNKGYVRLYNEKPAPNNFTKFVYEHRKNLADALGRALAREEIVHHIDKNRYNNILENLELLANRLEHLKRHPEWRAMINASSEVG